MSELARQKVVVIVGPTGSGKTGLSIELAKKFSGEIISADSRQVYKRLDIGTEKITIEEAQGIPHHLIDVVEPNEVFSAQDFKKAAGFIVTSIAERNKLPIIVGGTGFYVDTLLYSQDFPEVPPNDMLRRELEPKTPQELHVLLSQRDPRRAESIDPHNKRRLIRALEIVKALGVVPESKHSDSPYESLIIGLDVDDKTLKQKLEERLSQTIEKGLIHEIENLRLNITDSRLNEFGLEYRIGLRHLLGEFDEATMKQEMLKELWQYVRRQRTWFKRNPDIIWYNPDQKEEIEAKIECFLES